MKLINWLLRTIRPSPNATQMLGYPQRMPAYNEPGDLQKLYRIRFGDPIADETRQTTWEVLCRDWFPKFIAPTDSVVELGAGGCEFINNVRANRRVAVDLNPDVANATANGVEFLETSASALSALADASIDVVFSSNFFEHLGDAHTLLDVLHESHRILKPNGKIITLMPNMAALGARYFDYLDHTLPLTDKSLVEALQMANFRPELVINKFLPYTAADRKRPVSQRSVAAYLRVPLAWKILGRQMFVVARRQG